MPIKEADLQKFTQWYEVFKYEYVSFQSSVKYIFPRIFVLALPESDSRSYDTSSFSTELYDP